ncbi:DUF4097 family beta strand repeat-containing protein [Marinoscillum sp. 108]|uniref:DUF4097 family beta strand repeat-containing protein n=1 Tax=Marinoscillum sp. 108 TaxID=2653151 RepID=UPI0012F002F6|nr:DUF4097 family beta strand repeat-containing protein [Marinoscillum sp. 108]VXD18426.1 conserved exported hypothetical protein [Marinoscillum sp. 108]
MKTLITVLLLAATWVGYAQTQVTESANVGKQELLQLNFDFADDITIQTWDKNEVYVEVSVSINDGEYDHIFTLDKMVTERAITISMDKDMWKKVDRKGENCNFQTEIVYRVFLPSQLRLKANTINGNFIITPMTREVELKTISGDIDITVAREEGLDFKAKTISGEIFSDLEIDFPEGKEGLRQVVGMNVRGKVNSGGSPMELETISGNIYLRKG